MPPTVPPTAAQLGAAIRLLREQRKMTIEALAGQAKIHWTYLSGIEHGKSNPSWNVIRRVTIALEVEIPDLARLAAKQTAPQA